MYPLAIPLDLAIKHGIFILWQHLLLRGHLDFPALNLLHALAQAAQRRVERADYRVDVAEALALPVLLVAGQAPGDFPA